MTGEIYWHAYELKPRGVLNALSTSGSRKGALLRVGDGYADLHPWPELGDEPIDRQLSLLAGGTPAALGARALHCARIDGDARRRGGSLFDGLEIPPSHFTVQFGSTGDAEQIREAGFSIVKLKASGEELPSGIERFSAAGLRLRIDFNACAAEHQVRRLLDRIQADAIDFLEDPTPYDDGTWRRLRDDLGVRLAADREKGGDAFDVLVIKPALEETPPNPTRPLVFTSSMDHPLGQMWAAWNAARAVADGKRVEACGLMTAHIYEQNEFSEMLTANGPLLHPPEGPGLGFDALLSRLDWRRLR